MLSASKSSATSAKTSTAALSQSKSHEVINARVEKHLQKLSSNAKKLPSIFGPYIDVFKDDKLKQYFTHILGLLPPQATNQQLAQKTIKKLQTANICLALYHDFHREISDIEPIDVHVKALSPQERQMVNNFQLWKSHTLDELKQIDLSQQDIDNITQKHLFNSNSNDFKAIEAKRDYHFQFMPKYQNGTLKVLNIYVQGSIASSKKDIQAQLDIAKNKVGRHANIIELDKITDSVCNLIYTCLMRGIEINWLAHSLGGLNARMLLSQVRIKLMPKINQDETLKAYLMKTYQSGDITDLVQKIIPDPLEFDGQVMNKPQVEFMKKNGIPQNIANKSINLSLWDFNKEKPENLLTSQMKVNELTPQTPILALEYIPEEGVRVKNPNSDSKTAKAKKLAFEVANNVTLPDVGDHGCAGDMRAFISANHRLIEQLQSIQ